MNRLFERVGRGGIHEENHKIAARTAEDIGKILTRERLLRSIREKTPESRSELAGILKRKGSNVYNASSSWKVWVSLSLRKVKLTSGKRLLLTMMRCILRFR